MAALFVGIRPQKSPENADFSSTFELLKDMSF